MKMTNIHNFKPRIQDKMYGSQYSLQKVVPPDLGPLKILTGDNQTISNLLLACLIDRRVRMEYSDAEESEDENDKHSQF
jgi:hypothetical protein